MRPDLVIDVRNDPESSLYVMPTIVCECRCRLCGWKGYRQVGFERDLNYEFPLTLDDATDLIRGQPSRAGCPKCPRGLDDFVEYIRATRRRR